MERNGKHRRRYECEKKSFVDFLFYILSCYKRSLRSRTNPCTPNLLNLHGLFFNISTRVFENLRAIIVETIPTSHGGLKRENRPLIQKIIIIIIIKSLIERCVH